MGGGSTGLEALNASWVSSISSRPRHLSRFVRAEVPARSHFRPDSGLFMASRESASGASSGRIRSLPSSRSSATRSARAQRLQSRPP